MKTTSFHDFVEFFKYIVQHYISPYKYFVYTLFISLLHLCDKKGEQILKKDDTLIIKINKEQKKEFIQICKDDDTSASREVRNFIKNFIKKHNEPV